MLIKGKFCLKPFKLGPHLLYIDIFCSFGTGMISKLKIRFWVQMPNLPPVGGPLNFEQGGRVCVEDLGPQNPVYYANSYGE